MACVKAVEAAGWPNTGRLLQDVDAWSYTASAHVLGQESKAMRTVHTPDTVPPGVFETPSLYARHSMAPVVSTTVWYFVHQTRQT